VGQVIRSCHKSVIIKKKKKQIKKLIWRKKTNEEKEKKSELTGLTLQIRLTHQILDSCRESLITK
jgi:Zn-finger protein